MSRVVDHSEEVRGVYIPIEGSSIVLPNAAVAEVISYVAPKDIASESPEWFSGEIVWRDVTVPVISFDRALGNIPVDVPDGQRRIAIFNTLNGSTNLPFIGIITKSIPRLVRIKTSNIIERSEDEQSSSLVHYNVILSGEEGIIPDLDHLEEMVAKVLSQCH